MFIIILWSTYLLQLIIENDTKKLIDVCLVMTFQHMHTTCEYTLDVYITAIKSRLIYEFTIENVEISHCNNVRFCVRELIIA